MAGTTAEDGVALSADYVYEPVRTTSFAGRLRGMAGPWGRVRHVHTVPHGWFAIAWLSSPARDIIENKRPAREEKTGFRYFGWQQ